MKIAAVSLLCQDERVYMAMKSAGTPCPWDGKIGPDAQAMWDKYPELRPDYKNFLVKAEIIQRIDEELAEIAKQEEEKRIAEENAKKLAKSKKEEVIVKEKKEILENPIILVHDD